jgi:hypothetical protein
MTIVTATQNPSEVFFSRTVRFVLEQSLQAFRWVVVNDHSTEASSLRRLYELKRWAGHHEPIRFLIVDNPSSTTQGNGPAAMNYGLRFVGDSPFVAILDDDDMWELNTLEKAALVMAWVPDAYAVSFDVVNHGDKEFLWKRGFYNGDESFFSENNIMQGSPFRSSVLRKCRFREDMADGGADWDFWMCMASHGMWGLHVPEHGNWYQWNAPDFRKRRWKAVTTHNGLEDTQTRIQRRYPNLLNEDAWPPMVLPLDLGEKHGRADIEDSRRGFKDQAPFANPVGLKVVETLLNGTQSTQSSTRRSILLALRDLSNHTAYEQALKITRQFAKAGQRLTVLLTHYIDGDEITTRRHQQLLQYTHDVFVAGSVAPLDRLPDLVAYLIESRGIKAIILLPDHSVSSQIILRRLVAAAAVLRSDCRVSNQPSVRRRPIPVAVIDAGSMNVGCSCADEEVSGEFCDKSSSPRHAMWFAVIRTSGVATRDEKTKECLKKRGYAKVMVLVESTGDAAITLMGYVTVAMQAILASQRKASSTFQEDNCSMFGFEPWPAFIRRRDLSNRQQRQEIGLDMRRIQMALQYRKKRFGFGRELQIACPELVYANSQWIDGLEAPISCADGGSEKGDMLDVPTLRTNAMRQCGAWCLSNMDGLRDRTDANVSLDEVGGYVLGWEFTGTCFRAIAALDKSPKCRNDIRRALKS